MNQNNPWIQSMTTCETATDDAQISVRMGGTFESQPDEPNRVTFTTPL